MTTDRNVSGACANTCGSASSVQADAMPAYDYVGEAKRHTLSQILIGKGGTGTTPTDIADFVNRAFDALDKGGDPVDVTESEEYRKLLARLQTLGEDFGCPGGVKRLNWLRTQLDELAKRRAEDHPDLEAADFSDALIWLKEKRRVARKGWNGKSQHVEIWMFPDSIQWGGPGQGIPMQPCFVLINTQGNAQPGWIPSTGDLMATDWYAVE